MWQRLYDLAVRVRELAPWEWMTETDVFGVEMPSSNRTIFVGVMGTLGQHLAVAVYPSPDAIRTFWALEADEHAEPERVLVIPQIQVSYEKSNQLEPDDRRVLKQLGLTFKGNRWPFFRTYKPGFAPWFLELDEAEMFVRRTGAATGGGAANPQRAVSPLAGDRFRCVPHSCSSQYRHNRRGGGRFSACRAFPERSRLHRT